MGFTFEASTKSADAPNLEDGIFDALFLGVDKKFIKGGKFGDGDRFEWTFALLDEEGERLQDTDPETGEVRYKDGDPVEIEVSGLTSTSTNTKSETKPRAVRYIKALSTPAAYAAFEAGEGLEIAPLTPCQVEVRVKDNGWPDIVNVLPPRKRRAATRRVVEDDEE